MVIVECNWAGVMMVVEGELSRRGRTLLEGMIVKVDLPTNVRLVSSLKSWEEKTYGVCLLLF